MIKNELNVDRHEEEPASFPPCTSAFPLSENLPQMWCFILRNFSAETKITWAWMKNTLPVECVSRDYGSLVIVILSSNLAKGEGNCGMLGRKSCIFLSHALVIPSAFFGFSSLNECRRAWHVNGHTILNVELACSWRHRLCFLSLAEGYGEKSKK